MKTIIFAAMLLTAGYTAQAQVGIGTTNPQGVLHLDGAKDNNVTGAPTAAQQANDFVFTAAGNVGIGTATPTNSLQVARDKTNYGGTGQIIATGATDPTQTLVLGYNTTTDKGFVQSVHNGVAWTDLLVQPNGNLGIGTIAEVTSKLEVNGASTNHVSYDAVASRTINYALSNLAYTTANPGTFALQNIKDGGTYTLSVRGTVSALSTFTAVGPAGIFGVKYANNRATEVNTETLYTFVVIGTTVYVYTATGF